MLQNQRSSTTCSALTLWMAYKRSLPHGCTCGNVRVKTTGALYRLLLYLRKDVGRTRKTVGILVFSILYAVGGSRLHWLDGQQAAKFEVLNHGEFLQTLEMEGWEGEKTGTVLLKLVKFRITKKCARQ